MAETPKLKKNGVLVFCSKKGLFSIFSKTEKALYYMSYKSLA